jgi:hypothetical protein
MSDGGQNQRPEALVGLVTPERLASRRRGSVPCASASLKLVVAVILQREAFAHQRYSQTTSRLRLAPAPFTL